MGVKSQTGVGVCRDVPFRTMSKSPSAILKDALAAFDKAATFAVCMFKITTRLLCCVTVLV